MTCGQGYGLESPTFKFGHSRLYWFGFTSDDGHLWRVLIGCDNISINPFNNCCNIIIWCANTSHQSFVSNLHCTHFSASSCCCTKCTIHIENSRSHQRCIFSQRVSGNHIWFVTVVIQCSFNR